MEAAGLCCADQQRPKASWISAWYPSASLG